MWRRSRSTYSTAWFPNTSVTNASVCSSPGPSPSWNFPNASIAVEKPSLHAPRTIAAAVMLRMRQTLGDGAGLARSVVSDMAEKVVRHEQQDHERRRQDRMAGQAEPDRQEQDDLDLLDQHVERVGQQPLEPDPAFADGEHDAGEPRLGQDHAGRGLGDVGCGGDGDPDLRLPQRRRVVRAVAAHADHVAVALQSLHQPVLLLRHDAREHAEFVRAQLVGKALRRANGAGDADLAGDRRRRDRRVAGHHDGADAHVAQRRR